MKSLYVFESLFVEDIKWIYHDYLVTKYHSSYRVWFRMWLTTGRQSSWNLSLTGFKCPSIEMVILKQYWNFHCRHKISTLALFLHAEEHVWSFLAGYQVGKFKLSLKKTSIRMQQEGDLAPWWWEWKNWSCPSRSVTLASADPTLCPVGTLMLALVK